MKITFKQSVTTLGLIIVIGLAGCTTTNYGPQRISSSAKGYLQQARQEQGTKQQQYQLLAVNQLLADNNLNDADQLLASLNQAQLDPAILDQKNILMANLELKRNKPKKAVKILHKLKNLKALPTDVQITYYETAISAHLRNNNLAYSTIARMSLNSLLTNPKLLLQNRNIIWHDLQTLSLDKLNKLLSRSNSSLLRGWFELAITAKQNANQPQQLITQIFIWQQKYPNHPANNILPQKKSLLMASQFYNSSQIALLLPLHGKFATMGQAVRDGFMTAFYNNINQLTFKPDIKIYDTSQAPDINKVYAQAINNGAQFIIGPMTKNNVHKLAKHSSIKVPTLALNYLPQDISAPPNFFQVGLSPSQAAIQAANKMWQFNTTNLLIITPKEQWNNNVQQVFIKQWQALGGKIVATLAFSSKKQLSTDIASILNIDQSKQRKKELNKLFNEKLKFSARRRQDIDGVFLIANPAQAQQIQPLLRFYYAGNLPIFSIEDIYRGYPNTLKDQDLNGIYFDDMPWTIVSAPEINKLKSQIQKLWPDNYRTNNRLYALGIDSFTIYQQLYRLIYLPNFALNGTTGQLTLTHNQQISRQLSWARFKDGKAVALK